MHEFHHRMRSGIDEGTVNAGEAEQSDGQVLGQQLVQADHAEALHKTDLVLRQVTEEHRGVPGSDVGHIIVDDIALAEDGTRLAHSGVLLPDVLSVGVLDLRKSPEGLVVEHELALLGISGIHPGNEVYDVVEGDATSGCAILNGSGSGDDTLRLASARTDGEVFVHTASEGVGSGCGK